MEAGDSGHHVGLRRLIAYREGTLPAAEREAVQEHLSLCPRCTRHLLELRDFTAAAAAGESGPEPLRQQAWESLARRLPAATPVVRPIAGTAGRATPERRLPRLASGVAAVLLVAFLGLNLWAALTVLQERQRLASLEQRLEERDATLTALQSDLAETERQLAEARGQIQELEKRGTDRDREEELAARVAELSSALDELRRTERIAQASRAIEVSLAPRFTTRGQEAPGGFLRAGGVVNPVRTPPGEDRFTVALSLADHPVYSEYRLELLDRDGKVLWDDRRPGSSLLGEAGTSVSVRGLGPGRYRLRIEGVQPDRRELLGDYLLDVETR